MKLLITFFGILFALCIVALFYYISFRFLKAIIDYINRK